MTTFDVLHFELESTKSAFNSPGNPSWYIPAILPVRFTKSLSQGRLFVKNHEEEKADEHNARVYEQSLRREEKRLAKKD
jgi:hypothetical protein